MRRPHPIALIPLMATLLPVAAGPLSAAVTTTFDVGLDGWTVTGDNASAWNASGGNPGGCLAVNDLATGADNVCVAPVAYHGDWRGLGPADTLAVDYYFHYINGTIAPPLYTFRISGPGGAAHAVGGPSTVPPMDVWTHYAVTLDPAQWVIESGTWQGLLASVNSVLVFGEFVTGQEQVFIDNVRLSGTILPVFVGCVVADFSAPGTEEWSFSGTVGVTNPGSGGNGGGFCSIGDGAGNSYAFAPARFLGNWSSLDGSGRLSIDLRVLARGGVDEGAPELIRLSGPGGQASVALGPGALPASARVWKRLTFPLAAGSWTLTSGTWAGLLANVTECRIDLEYFGSTETIGFDNFARLASGCPDPDIPLTLAAGHSLCGFHSLVGARNAALNPADGLLYAVINLTAGSGGGLYAVSGPSAGALLQAYPNPAHLLFEPDGDVYVTEDFAGVVDRFAAGVSTLWVSGFHSGDEDLAGLCVAPPGFDGTNVDPGDVLVTDYGFTGAPDEIWGFSFAAAENERLVVPDPGNVEIYDLTGAPGAVWACDFFDANNLSRFSPEGARTLLPLVVPVPGMVSIVYDDGSRRLYVASQTQGTVCQVDPLTGVVTTVATGFDSLDICSLEIDVAQRHLYVTDVAYGRVYVLCLPAATAADAVPAAGVTGLAAVPNPLTSLTRLRFELAAAARVRIAIHDLAGRRVRLLADERRAAGIHAIGWDGRDQGGHRVAAGVYLATLEAAGSRCSARLVVLR